MGCGIFTHIVMAVATGLALWARLNCLLVLALVVVILASLGIILAWESISPRTRYSCIVFHIVHVFLEAKGRS